MENDREHLDAVEQALVELRAAERAGVFQPTREQASAFMRAGVADKAMGSRRLAMRLLAVAAVLLLAVTVWTGMFRHELGKLRDQRNSMVAGIAPGDVASMSFADCMSGPSVTEVPASCLEYDRNSDGFVDLQDYGVLQLASARAAP